MDGVFQCQLPEVAAHSHSEACYEVTEGHSHLEDCYDADHNLICGQEEKEAEKTLICGRKEVILHTHTGACGSDCTLPVVVEHTHTEQCKTPKTVATEELICAKREHKHSDSCYSNRSADLEEAADWEKTLPKQLCGQWREDILAVAKTQLGYTESQDNYEVMDDGTHKGYTRYGQWYGDKYGDWCAMFASFCLHYAGVDAEQLPGEANCQNWINLLSKEEYQLYHEAASDYEPQVGDLIFFEWGDGDDKADHVGILAEIREEKEAESQKTKIILKTIEGNAGDQVRCKEYELGDDAILGYGEIPAQEFTCGKTGHLHSTDCKDENGKQVCGLEEHVHEAGCILVTPTAGQQQKIDKIIALIDQLPSAEEIGAKMEEYEAAEDTEGYEAYYQAIYDQVLTVYVQYEELSEALRSLVTNAEKLMQLEWIWSANVLNDSDDIMVYQINTHSESSTAVGKAALFYGKSPGEWSCTFGYHWWTALVVEEDNGKLYLKEIISTGGVDKSNIGPKSENGFVLFVWHGAIDAEKISARVDDEVIVSFDYKKTCSYNASGYGWITFSNPKENKPKLTTVQSADTKDLITVNLYDYSTNINDPYNKNKNLPGFQQDQGQLSVYGTHSSNFGNNITEDLAAGDSKVTITDGTNINATVKDTKGNYANQPNSGMMLSTLGTDGYPALADKTSLSYLFSTNTYATKKNTANINGLFQQDPVTGAYTFNSRENHAQFDAGTNSFTLYDQIISSNFIWYPFGNFLPFNDIVTQTTQASTIDRAYFLAVAERAQKKYDQGAGEQYKTLATVLNSWITKMDAEYPNGWDGVKAINEYFNSTGPGSKLDGTEFDFSEQAKLLEKVYSIDYDKATDFYFGMEMQMHFFQPKDGMTGNDTNKDGKSDYPMEFYFTGDDDVWVYIDGKLFLDLSGIHRHVGGKIDFVNGVITYYELDVASGDVATEPYKTVGFKEILGSTAGLKEVKHSDGTSTWTFDDYTDHSFNFYYMERGAGSGVCRMNFNFPLLKRNSISVQKELTADDASYLPVLGNPDFKFQILQADEAGNKTEKLFIGANESYDLYDQNNNKIGSGVTDSNGIFALKAGQRAEFAGIKEDAGKYYVRELFDESTLGQYGEVKVSGGSTTESNGIKINSQTFIGKDSSVKDISDGTTKFRFENKIATAKLGSLQISKNLEKANGDSAEANQEFEFQVTLDGTLLPVGTTYTVGTENRTVETAGIIKIKAGETAVLSKILAGSAFTVTETEASAKGYTVTYSGSDGVNTSGGQAAGVIKIGTAVQVTVTNSENGANVTVAGKKIVENPDEQSRKVAFLLEEVDATGKKVENGLALRTDIDAVDQNEFQFVLSYLERNIKNFPATYYYKITEVESSESSGSFQLDPTAYLIQVDVSKTEAGELKAEVVKQWVNGEEKSGEIQFVNTLLYDLVLEKKVEGIQTKEEFTFEIMLKDKSGKPVTGTFKTSKNDTDNAEIAFNDKGVAKVTLQDKDRLRIKGLPYGTQWTITEKDSHGYTVSYQVGTQDSKSGSTAEGTVDGNVITFQNTAIYELPESGGIGTMSYTIGGILLMLIPITLLLYKYFRRGKGAY